MLVRRHQLTIMMVHASATCAAMKTCVAINVAWWTRLQDSLCLEDPRRSPSVLTPPKPGRQTTYNYSPANPHLLSPPPTTPPVLRRTFEWVKLYYLPSRRLLPTSMNPLYVVVKSRTPHQTKGNSSRTLSMAILRPHSTLRTPSPPRKLRRNCEWTSGKTHCECTLILCFC
jgi:hypothetical protein